MEKFSLHIIQDLLKEADVNNIILSYGSSGLVVKYPKERKPDPLFLNRLKANKDNLCEYLRKHPVEKSRNKITAPAIEHDGKKYYEVGITQYYWINEAIDYEYKQKLFALLRYKITGQFDVSAFKSAIRFVIRRHESLRACFNKVNTKYYMRIKEADDPVFTIDYSDLTATSLNKSAVDEAVCFTGHRFNVQEGPLFIVRLLRIDNTTCLLSIKLHHAIFDAWSIDVLLKDLLTAYYAYACGREPHMPELPLQYKELMCLLNQQTELYYDTDKQYWSSLYKILPRPLDIPGKRGTGGSMEDIPVCKMTGFSISGDCLQVLNALSKKYSVSLFLVLQALLKFYLYRLTGQRDIVLGTEVFGRDIVDGTENQIGFYSKMRFVRTIFDDKNDFINALLQVKRSNEDMQQHIALPLLDYLSTFLSPGESVFQRYCNITINYTDTNGYMLNKDQFDMGTDQVLSIEPYDTGQEPEPLINWDLDFRFYRLTEKIEGSLVYNTATFDGPAIQTLANGLVNFVEQQAKSFPVGN